MWVLYMYCRVTTLVILWSINREVRSKTGGWKDSYIVPMKIWLRETDLSSATYRRPRDTWVQSNHRWRNSIPDHFCEGWEGKGIRSDFCFLYEYPDEWQCYSLRWKMQEELAGGEWVMSIVLSGWTACVVEVWRSCAVPLGIPDWSLREMPVFEKKMRESSLWKV